MNKIFILILLAVLLMQPAMALPAPPEAEFHCIVKDKYLLNETDFRIGDKLFIAHQNNTGVLLSLENTGVRFQLEKNVIRGYGIYDQEFTVLQELCEEDIVDAKTLLENNYPSIVQKLDQELINSIDNENMFDFCISRTYETSGNWMSITKNWYSCNINPLPILLLAGILLIAGFFLYKRKKK